ncbi:MAG: sensor domain-containing protein [Segniliparus sp.]|uniref:sensor domain-containing protein n=1 Tax=Segniliparus sp. TaxID=2804064 RepID=UPI003F3741DD
MTLPRLRKSCAHLTCATVLGLAGTLSVLPQASAAPENSASQIVLPLAEAATLLAIPLTAESPFGQPRRDFQADLPACADAADIGTPQTFGRPDLASFHGSLLRDDSAEGRYIVKQAAGVFGSLAAAAAAQGELVTHVAACLKAQGLDRADNADSPGSTGRNWMFTSMNAATERLSWRKVENQENGWQCGLVSQAQGNTLLQALVCERNPPPKGPATELLNAMAARIPPTAPEAQAPGN